MNIFKNEPLFLAIVACLTLVGSVFLGLIFRDPRAIPLGFVLIPGLVVAWRNPRLGLLAFLVYLPLSSTFAFAWAKVFVVKGNMIRYTGAYPLYKTAKDAFYLGALGKILWRTDTWSKFAPKFRPLLIAVAVLTISLVLTFLFVNVTNSNPSSIFRGLVGLKIILGYIPLVLAGYYLLEKPKHLWVVTRLLVVMVIICCTLAFVQYFLLSQEICPRNYTLNEVAPQPELARFFPDIREKVTLKAQCFVGGSVLFNPGRGLIRLPGTFSDPWQWAWFLISSSFITAAASASEPDRRWRFTSYVSIALVFLATLISGQRAAILVVPIVYFLLFLLTQKYNPWWLVKFALLSISSFLAVSQIGFLRDRWENLSKRWQYDPPTNFMLEQFQWLVNNRLSLLGQGLGKASSAVRRLVTETDNIRLIETYYVKLIYETGLLGFLAFMTVATILTILTFKAFYQLKDRSLRNWGLGFWAFILFMSFNPYYYPLSVEPVSVYYWLFAGMLLRLPALAEPEKLEESSQLQPPLKA